jgi:phospholipid-binding lipoprotein MlaA
LLAGADEEYRENFHMLKVKHGCAGLGLVLTLSVCGCVTLPPNSQRSPQDPWESWNRGVYKVNTTLDKAVAKPVARTYVRALPSPVRTGISNFFENLRTTTVMVNDVLQGKFKAAANDLARFLLNTTVSVSADFWIRRRRQDWTSTMRTLGKPWGIGASIPARLWKYPYWARRTFVMGRAGSSICSPVRLTTLETITSSIPSTGLA